MRYVAAYLLAVLGGNSSPSPSDIKEILECVGVTYDAEKADTVCGKLKGKDVNEVRNYSKKQSMSQGFIIETGFLLLL